MPVVPISQRPQGPVQAPVQPPPDTYSLMAAAQMHSEGRLVKPYEVKDPAEMGKWDETLDEHGAIQMPAPDKGQPWKEFFGSKTMQEYLKQQRIERQDLPDGGVILRRLSNPNAPVS